MPNSILDQIAIITVMLFFAMVAGIYMERWRAKAEWAERRSKNAKSGGFYKRSKVVSIGPQADKVTPMVDAADQLKTVMGAQFERQAILNHSESRLYSTVERTMDELDMDCRLMAQVSLGEILRSSDKAAYWAINSKCVDMLIVDLNGMPVSAIEYQGGGHHQGTAAARDAVKKEALRRAGVGYIEICKGDTPAELRLKLAKLAAPERPERPVLQ